MTSTAAVRDGIRRVNRAPVLLVSVFLITLLTAVPFAMMLQGALREHFANSMAAEHAARGMHYQWWTEFAAQSGALGRSFETTIIGFAAVLDNLSALLDRETRPAPILWLGGCYLLLWLFLAGGIIDRYARGRPTRAYEFFAACGMYFGRFLRLAPLIAATYYVLFSYVHPLLFGNVYEELTRDITAERTAFALRVGLYAIFGGLLILPNMVFDFTKVRAVVEDRRSMLGALAAGARFVRRSFPAVVSLYVLNGSLFIGTLVAYALLAPGAESSGVALWLGFAVGQLYLLARLWVRLLFFASETALFQGRLAHASYVAGPPIPRPEPPIVESLAKSRS